MRCFNVRRLGLLAALVFVGTQALCLAAALLSCRKVAMVDPAIVFRG